MTYPVTYRKLFDNQGAGPKLREDIIPASSVTTNSQTFSTVQKAQARTNIDAASDSELKTALSELITEYGGTVPSS